MKTLSDKIRLWWMAKLLVWMLKTLPVDHPKWSQFIHNMNGIADLLDEY